MELRRSSRVFVSLTHRVALVYSQKSATELIISAFLLFIGLPLSHKESLTHTPHYGVF